MTCFDRAKSSVRCAAANTNITPIFMSIYFRVFTFLVQVNRMALCPETVCVLVAAQKIYLTNRSNSSASWISSEGLAPLPMPLSRCSSSPRGVICIYVFCNFLALYFFERSLALSTIKRRMPTWGRRLSWRDESATSIPRVPRSMSTWRPRNELAKGAYASRLLI